MAGGDWKVFVLFQREAEEKAGAIKNCLLTETQGTIARMLRCPEAKYPQIPVYAFREPFYSVLCTYRLHF